MDVAIAARQRVHGLPPGLAMDQKAGSELGRLCLAGDITEPQFQAGERFFKAHAEMLRATLGPRGLETVEPASSGDKILDEYIVWAMAAVGAYRAAKDRLSLPEWFAVQAVVLEDRKLAGYMPLTSGLTVLAMGYGFIPKADLTPSREPDMAK